MSQEREIDLKGKEEAKRDEIPDADLDKVAGGVGAAQPDQTWSSIPGLAAVVPVKGSIKVKLKKLASVL